MAARVIIFGATGSLGRHVLGQAIAAGHDVSVLVRDATRLPPEVRDRISIQTGDLREPVPPAITRGHNALINCAGHVADGQGFVDLVDRVIASVEALHAAERPICWFLAGAALLDLDALGRRGVDLPQMGDTYSPHRSNFERLERSTLDWRLLCPGPMVEQLPIGVDRLRITLDRLPVEMPPSSGTLTELQLVPVLATLIPRMRIPYADAAGLMLANLDPGSAMTRRRVGIAPPAESVPANRRP